MNAILKMGVVAATLCTTALVANAETTLQIQTSTKSGDFQYKYIDENWGPKVSEMTNGEVSVKFTPINSIVDRKDTADAIAAGALEGDLTSIAYFSGRNPAFAILGDLIAGYDSPAQVQQFCREGGGEAALQALWDQVLPDSLVVVGCGPVSKEALVAKTPIRGVADLEGLKIRSPSGLAAAVFQAAGAAPASIPFGDVFTSLEKGVIDAADASAYVNNDSSGLNEIAPYPLYPGIHSMAVHQFTVSKATWDGLSPEAQAGLKEWFYTAYADVLQTLDAKDKELVERDIADPDIEVIDWPQEERDAFRAIAQEVWKETAAKTPEAQAALDAHFAFMKDIGLISE
ncbi:MAG: TRAP transporter substrate-binding protein DctP [Pseudomonadota bacterium]